MLPYDFGGAVPGGGMAEGIRNGLHKQCTGTIQSSPNPVQSHLVPLIALVSNPLGVNRTQRIHFGWPLGAILNYFFCDLVVGFANIQHNRPTGE